jgi:hypothetical protein
MDIANSSRPTQPYPVTDTDTAVERADAVLRQVAVGHNADLEDRLTGALSQWLEPVPAHLLAGETNQLYQLLTERWAGIAEAPVQGDTLRRALILAMTRPADDPCWRDYKRIIDATAARWESANAEYGIHPLRTLRRKLTRSTPDRNAQETAWAQPTIEARRNFKTKWRT